MTELPRFCHTEESYLWRPLKVFEAQINLGIAFQRFSRAAMYDGQLSVEGTDVDDLAAQGDTLIDEGHANAQQLCAAWNLRLRVRINAAMRCINLEAVL